MLILADILAKYAPVIQNLAFTGQDTDTPPPTGNFVDVNPLYLFLSWEKTVREIVV